MSAIEFEKALETCTNIDGECTDCCLNKDESCRCTLTRNIVFLYKRKQKEIESLKEKIEDLKAMLDSNNIGQSKLERMLAEKVAEVEDLKLEYAGFQAGVKQFAKDGKMVGKKAVIEFAEAVKLEFYREFDEIIPSIMADNIDNLVKEMVGEG